MVIPPFLLGVEAARCMQTTGRPWEDKSVPPAAISERVLRASA